MKYFMISALITALASGVNQRASASPMIYADWTVTSGDGGTGTFSGVAGLPDFSFTIDGEHLPSETKVDDNDDFDHAPWEALFGEGDNQESLRFRSDSDGSMAVSTLTISFASPVDASSLWGFAVTDLEGEDAVISASLGGVPVSTNTVVGWFQGLFDSKPSDGGINLPSGFDLTNAAVVAQYDSDGLLSDEIGITSSGSGSPSAWFLPNTTLDTLTIVHRNRSDDGRYSMHVYMASSTVPEPSSLVLLGIGALGLFGYSRRRRKISAPA